MRVASSYRRTWFGFFQADYAASKSAKALIRAIRDKKVIDEEMKKKIANEIGDVLWYLAQLCTELKLSLGKVAEENLKKLFSRKQRNVLHGEGDER